MAETADTRRLTARLLGLAGVMLLVAGCGSVSPTRTAPATGLSPLPSSTPGASTAAPSISSPALAALAGTWTGSPVEEPTDHVTIAFVTCGDGGQCGTGTWQHANRCDFTLTHTGTDAGVLVFTVAAARQMQCGWGGPATGTTYRVSFGSDGTLDLRHSSGMPPVTLSRSQGPGS